MNEGHSAFLALERIRHLMETHQLSVAEARAFASPSLVFIHTPVKAGHDYFSPDQIDRYFGGVQPEFGPIDAGLALGRPASDAQSEFCMTVLALRLSSHCNGVSKLHGDVSWHNKDVILVAD